MDSEAEALITRVYYRFQNGLAETELLEEESKEPKKDSFVSNKSESKKANVSKTIHKTQ